MQIKICGLKRNEDVDYVNQTKPDCVGFVFAGAKRKIDYDTAKMLREKLDPSIPSVGVFVNAKIEFVVQLLEEGVIQIVQLHGDEDANYIQNLRHELEKSVVINKNMSGNITIIKAIRVKSSEEVLEAEKMAVDYLLLDAFQEDEYGGSGKVFDHNLIPKLKKPYFLAGGITEGNVVGILDLLKRKDNLPYCVDVSSSVETDGLKDRAKIAQIVEVVHEYF